MYNVCKRTRVCSLQSFTVPFLDVTHKRARLYVVINVMTSCLRFAKFVYNRDINYLSNSSFALFPACCIVILALVSTGVVSNVATQIIRDLCPYVSDNIYTVLYMRVLVIARRVTTNCNEYIAVN